jgi:hypothetical protein
MQGLVHDLLDRPPHSTVACAPDGSRLAATHRGL